MGVHSQANRDWQREVQGERVPLGEIQNQVDPEDPGRDQTACSGDGKHKAIPWVARPHRVDQRSPSQVEAEVRPLATMRQSKAYSEVDPVVFSVDAGAQFRPPDWTRWVLEKTSRSCTRAIPPPR